MTMRIKVLLCFLLSGLLFASCSNNAVIKGHVSNTNNELLELSIGSNPKKIIDTLRLKPSGNFSLKYDFKKHTSPVFLSLSASGKPLAALLVEPGEKVVLETDMNNLAKYKISGSEGSMLLKELNDMMLGINFSIDSILNVLNSYEAEEYNSRLDGTNAELTRLFNKYKQLLAKFIVKNNKSYASYNALYQTLPSGVAFFDQTSDMMYYQFLADSLETKYARSPIVTKLRADHKKFTQSIALDKLMDNVEETSMPEINLPNTKGENVSLKSLSGKVILLDFWVSSSKETTMNNLELLPLYEKYHSKGFEIYQVSLDVSRDNWLGVINNQKLPWINVCDYAGTNTYAARIYNVTKLPANYLISKDGEIVGKNLFGDALEEKLKAELQK